MINSQESQIIKVANTSFGELQAEILPFENALIDFSNINQYLFTNPAVIAHVIPDSIINSCSECCTETINGKPNMLGRLHRLRYKDCGKCPVNIASERIPARDANGEYIRNREGRIMSEAEVTRMLEDGTA